jgi:hypothetical protein
MTPQNRDVNPVDVWEGVNTQEPVGRNRLVKLAVHVLSIVANSAGCEQAFSHMGLVQTATRSKLSMDKVRKTTMVGMDIKRSHIEAGLVRTRERRDFGMPETSSGRVTGLGEDSEVAVLEVDDLEILDFDQLAKQLVEDASEDVVELDADEDPQMPLTIRLPLQAIHSALQETPPARSAAIKIPLKSLFIFPEDLSITSELAYFWKGGIQNLEKEMAVHETLCSNQENLQPEESQENVVGRG